MSGIVRKVVGLWLCLALAGCGGVYHVNPIIKTDRSMALSWREYPGFFCGKCAPWRGACEQDEYINPYTYNPEFADTKGNLDGPSLYKPASAGDDATQFTVAEIQEPCRLAQKIADREDRLSDHLFRGYSTAFKKSGLLCSNNRKEEGERVARKLTVFLNQQLISSNLYTQAGLNQLETSVEGSKGACNNIYYTHGDAKLSPEDAQKLNDRLKNISNSIDVINSKIDVLDKVIHVRDIVKQIHQTTEGTNFKVEQMMGADALSKYK